MARGLVVRRGRDALAVALRVPRVGGGWVRVLRSLPRWILLELQPPEQLVSGQLQRLGREGRFCRGADL
jgi:hypothetical protein